jgi:RNA polymerase sigma-70 factor (ECF subfamily)
MDDQRDSIAAWVAREILPHEGSVRGWATRRWGSLIDVDDVIQEVYCRIAGLDSVTHIENGRAYVFTTVQAVVMDGFRRAKVANTKPMTEIDWFDVEDDSPLADRRVEAIQELGRVNNLLSGLSATGRRVIELRRIHGLSQKETAQQLGVSESVVENHIVRGLRRILKTIAEQDAGIEDSRRN